MNGTIQDSMPFLFTNPFVRELLNKETYITVQRQCHVCLQTDTAVILSVSFLFNFISLPPVPCLVSLLLVP